MRSQDTWNDILPQSSSPLWEQYLLETQSKLHFSEPNSNLSFVEQDPRSCTTNAACVLGAQSEVIAPENEIGITALQDSGYSIHVAFLVRVAVNPFSKNKDSSVSSLRQIASNHFQSSPLGPQKPSGLDQPQHGPWVITQGNLQNGLMDFPSSPCKAQQTHKQIDYRKQLALLRVKEAISLA